MATMIYLMEINEWGTDSSPDLCAKLANEAFQSAEAFYKVANSRDKPVYNTQGATSGRLQGRTSKPKFPPNQLHSEGAVKMTTVVAPDIGAPPNPVGKDDSGREPRWGSCEAS